MTLPRPLPDEMVAGVVQGLVALGEPCRLRIIEALDRRGPTNVQALADELGTSQQNTSKHLAVLHRAGLVQRRLAGRVVWYCVARGDIYPRVDEIGTMIIGHKQPSDSSQ